MVGARGEHDETIEAERNAARFGHVCDGFEKHRVDRIGIAIDPLPLVHLDLETALLLGGIGQFAEPVGELDAADIKLKTFGKAFVVLQAGECRLRRRIIDEKRGAAVAEAWLDFFRQDLAEEIRPAVVVDDAQADGCGLRGKGRTIAAGGVIGREKIDPGVAAGTPRSPVEPPVPHRDRRWRHERRNGRGR